MKKIILLFMVIAAVFFMSGCSTERYYTRHNENRDRYRYKSYDDRYYSHPGYYHRRYYRPHYRSGVGVNIHVHN
jgi:uncharacterized protein YceK